MNNTMNTIKVPMTKEAMMQGLLNSMVQSTKSNTQTPMLIVKENGVSSFKDQVQVKKEPIEATMMRRYLNGDHLSPIGPLTLLQTNAQQIKRKFLKSKMTYKDCVQYRKHAKKLGLF